MTFTVRHGIDDPNRNRWFTVLNSMVDLSMANWQCHNQMVQIDLFEHLYPSYTLPFLGVIMANQII